MCDTRISAQSINQSINQSKYFSGLSGTATARSTVHNVDVFHLL